MSPSDQVSRRDFLNQSLAVAGTAGVLSGSVAAAPREAAAEKKPVTATPAEATALPCGTLGRAKISRLLLGGNLIGGYMHCRDLKYVNSLINQQVDTGAVALYVWGVSADPLIRDGQVGVLARAVEIQERVPDTNGTRKSVSRLCNLG